MAESAVGLVIQNLNKEIKLLEGFEEGVTSIKSEMDMIQSFLKDAEIRAEKDDRRNVEKTWVKQVREEAYRIEDVIDKYILHFAEQPQRRSQCLNFLQKIFHITINLKARHEIALEIQSINRILEGIRKRGETFGFSAIEQGTSSHDATNDTWPDPRLASLFMEEDEVVGIESHRDRLVNWLIKGQSNRMVFSVVGIGGLGKTTLVKKVYDNDEVIAHFDCRAWITVSQPYKMGELLRDMMKQLYKESTPREIETMKVASLVEELKHYLRERSYVVILDDIWDTRFWDCIKCAFPNNGKGNRIIITTRNKNVAPSNNESLDYDVYPLPFLPFDKALELFCKKAFQRQGGKCPSDFDEFSRVIVERCKGLPLAIVALGGLFSTRAQVLSEWHKVLNSLSSEFKTDSRLRDIIKILSFSYYDLPYNLKVCFLYFGMIPEDCTINCARLTRLWIAEGFVKEMKGLTLEDIAQDYLNQLIHRSLVQVDREDFTGRIRNCRVQDMMHEVILSRSEELSFDLVSMSNFSNSYRNARRLSIQNNVNNRLQSITSYQTRSILILGENEVPNSFLATCFTNFKLLKIMDCEGALIDYIPQDVGNLFHLRYLSLRDTKVQVLPESIGKLHNLETLDLKRSLVSKLPAEISGLCKLRYLAAYNIDDDIECKIDFRRGVKIPKGIKHLVCLQKLQKVEADNTALIEELGMLRHLRKLDISKLKRENGIALCATLEKLSCLQSLRINATSEEEVLELQLMSSPPRLLKTLCLGGRLEKLPEWIPELKSIVRIELIWSRLVDDPLKVLQAQPTLMSLWLDDGYGGEQLHFKGEGFQKLKNLGLRNLGGLNRLIIDEGALPLLERLVIGPSPQLKEVPSGIHHLKGLKILQFYDMPTEFVLSLRLDEAPNFEKFKHIPSVFFWYRTQGEYKRYKLGDSELLKLLRS